MQVTVVATFELVVSKNALRLQCGQTKLITASSPKIKVCQARRNRLAGFSIPSQHALGSLCESVPN
jgi:hypothetical protein